MALNYSKVVQLGGQAFPICLITNTSPLRTIKIKQGLKGHLNILLEGRQVGRIETSGVLSLTSDKELISTTLSKYLEEL